MRFTAPLRPWALPLALVAPMLWFALAASPAAALEDEATSRYACQVNETIFAMKEALCAESEFDCALSEQACAQVCKVASEGCRRTSRAAIKTLNLRVRSQMRVLRVLCRNAENRGDCRKFAKGWHAALAAETRQARKQLARACRSDELQATCNDVCNGDAEFPACETPLAIEAPELDFELFQHEVPLRPQEGVIINAVGLDETIVLGHSGENLVLRARDMPRLEGLAVRAFESQAELDAFLAQQAEGND